MTPYRRPGLSRTPIRPDRVRCIDCRGFAFIPNRFLHDGYFASLTHAERSLYFFLVIAGDRNGVSFYSSTRICSMLELTPDAYAETRDSLIAKDLIAVDSPRFQVLSLPSRLLDSPSRPIRIDNNSEHHDLASIRQLLRSGPYRR
jgi:hypothetical protein